MKRILTFAAALALLFSAGAAAYEKEYIWPKGKMPDARTERQIAAMTSDSQAEGFKPDKWRLPYLEWFDRPDVPNDVCVVLISGGGYNKCCDVKWIERWRKMYTELGCQCVSLVYRTPRPEGLPFWKSGIEDGQRAIRLVRSQAGKRGFDPERIAVVSQSAGSHMAMLLATSSTRREYEPVDRIDSVSCHINIGIINSPAYLTSDGAYGGPATRQGYGPEITLDSLFLFDSKTCPLGLYHGGADIYSPNGSTLVYRRLRQMKIPAELHLYADKPHGVWGMERGAEFLRQMGWFGTPEPEVSLMERYPSDDERGTYMKEDVWPEGKMPCRQEHQCLPYLEWHFPKNRTTDAIQIIYSGGSYNNNSPDGFEVAPIRRYLNGKGVTVVTLKYRTPRPKGMPKHITAWQDLQRAVKIVRSKAASYGLDPERIGIMGSSAGGHLTLMGATSSLHQSYKPIDDIDKLSCSAQWAVAIYPAYALTDGAEKHNIHGGNTDADILVPEFSFDLKTCPTIFIHGDADGWASMNSVKTWEKMRAMGVQSELHTLALRPHCFQRQASPGTGSYNWMDRIWDFLVSKGFVN